MGLGGDHILRCLRPGCPGHGSERELDGADDHLPYQRVLHEMGLAAPAVEVRVFEQFWLAPRAGCTRSSRWVVSPHGLRARSVCHALRLPRAPLGARAATGPECRHAHKPQSLEPRADARREPLLPWCGGVPPDRLDPIALRIKANSLRLKRTNGMI